MMDPVPGRITRRDARGTEFRDTAGRRWVFPPAKPSYASVSGLRCFMFVTAAVYAATREEAEAFADVHQLRGPLAHEYLAELSS